MIETFIALLFAHVLADFVLQTDWMALNKRNPIALVAHVAIVLATALAVCGILHPALLALAGIHLVIDAAKAWSPWRGFAPFLLDQALHLASLVAVAFWVPDLWALGAWGAIPTEDSWTASLWPSDGSTPILPAIMVALTGLILATRAGGFGIGLYMEPWSAASPKGLPQGGRAIGLLERSLIFLLVLIGMPESIGFLIAAKSVLRFGSVNDDRKVSEYVIIGTLASFGWAILVSFATVWALQYLTPLGIPDLSP
ncbi:MAG: DUF3307 domain-containing protein [Paracoccaceae bacterium]